MWHTNTIMCKSSPLSCIFASILCVKDYFWEWKERERESNLRRQRLASPTAQVLVDQTKPFSFSNVLLIFPRSLFSCSSLLCLAPVHSGCLYCLLLPLFLPLLNPQSTVSVRTVALKLGTKPILSESVELFDRLTPGQSGGLGTAAVSSILSLALSWCKEKLKNLLLFLECMLKGMILMTSLRKGAHMFVLQGILPELNGHVQLLSFADEGNTPWVILYFKVARDSFGSNKMCQFFCQNLLFMAQAVRKWNNTGGHHAPFFRKWVRTFEHCYFWPYGVNGKTVTCLPLGRVHTGGERFFGVNGDVTSFDRVTPWKNRAAFTPGRSAARAKRPNLAKPWSRKQVSL